jgi:tricorn protease-like protein
VSDLPQLFAVSAQGGLPAKLPVPYGIDGAVSADGQWLAYAKGCGKTPITAIWFYNIATGERHQVTSGMFNDSSPVFDRTGGYFYYKQACSPFCSPPSAIP